MRREVQRTPLSLLANRLCLRVKQFPLIFVTSKQENTTKYIAERGHSIYGDAASDSAGLTLDMFRLETAYSVRTVYRVTSFKKIDPRTLCAAILFFHLFPRAVASIYRLVAIWLISASDMNCMVDSHLSQIK